MTLQSAPPLAGSESMLRERLMRGDVPVVDQGEGTAPGERCHFACPVRHGRRRSDTYGRLVLSTTALHYRGAQDTTIQWHDVLAVGRHGAEIVITARGHARALHFCCGSEEEALYGAMLAEHLALKGR